MVDAIRAVLQGGVVFSSLDQTVTLQRSLPHGHVAVLLGLAVQLGLPRILHRTRSRQRNLALTAQIRKIQNRFRVGRIALVGDRGMITAARIRQDLSPAGLDWISALRSVDIRKLLHTSKSHPAPLHPESLVADTVAEILSPQFPGERLLVCLNPRLRQQRARKARNCCRPPKPGWQGSPQPPASTSPVLITGTAR